jgi:hypothetical protein
MIVGSLRRELAMRSIEFYVEYWVAGDAGRFTVIGRCGDEPIFVNDTFDAIFRYKHRRYPDEVGDEPVREVEKPVSLRVECIHAYERSLSTLGQGMTGSLVLEGEGAVSIAAGWALGRREPLPDRVDTEAQAATN